MEDNNRKVPFLKVFIILVTILLVVYVLASWPGGMWDLDQGWTHPHGIGRQSLSDWIAKEVLGTVSFIDK